MLTASVWTALFLPLLSAAAIFLLTLNRKRTSAAIACSGMALSFAASVVSFAALAGQGSLPLEASLSWIELGGMTFEFGFLLDRLSALMLVLVTGVGSGIFFYSAEYMAGDDGYARYFALLSFFVFSMLGIVLANNFLQMFIFWELVGVSSYLLIGYWYERPEAADAGKKAFLVTRVGDVGFLIGILMLWQAASGLGSETLNFLKLEELLRVPGLAGSWVTPVSLLIFLGVVGKSAQFPLHVWLPDAMEGPTPVSALIHAATMVAAGVFLVARTFFLFSLSPAALAVVAAAGAVTAFFAAVLAVVQEDIKKILAYSTLSQLGLMVMALGLGSSGAAMYHLTTHAFFKALLFLGAGSVIHALHTQNIREMGGLLKAMPVTSGTFLVGGLALAGIFPTSGFFSKEGIMALAFARNPWLFATGLATVFLTSFYMGRLFFTAFTGAPKSRQHAHEPSILMRGPLMALAFLSLAAGFFGIGPFFRSPHDAEAHADWGLALAVSLVSLAGILASYLAAGARQPAMARLAGLFSPLRTLLENKFYLDALYDAFVRYVQQNVARLCNLFEEVLIVRGLVNGTAAVTGITGDLLRRLATGKVRFYALAFALGVSVMAFFVVMGGY